SRIDPCWTNVRPYRRCALPTSLRPPSSISQLPVRAKQNAGAGSSPRAAPTISTAAPSAERPAARARPIHWWLYTKSRAPPPVPRRGGGGAGGRGAADPWGAEGERARPPADVVRGGGDAVRELALRAVVVDGAAAGETPDEPHAETPARGDVDVLVERLAVAERDGRRRPGEEADRGRRAAGAPAEPHRLVDRHVRGAVGGLGHEQAPGPGTRVRHGP